MTEASATHPIRLGAVGLGRAFTVMVPTFTLDPRVHLVAGADPHPEARARFTHDFGGTVHNSLEELLAEAQVDAIYLATPVDGHVDQIRMLANAGIHVLMEKPMALNIAGCLEIKTIAEKAGIHLLIGHSHSFDTPYLKTRELINEGSLGRVRMITALNYTDFMFRPRRLDELDTSQGGGVVFSQAAHQIDILRLLGGGRVRSVRAVTGAWNTDRPTEGAYSALLTFEDGLIATAIYSGYAHFDSDEFIEWQGELGARKDPEQYWTARDNLASLTRDKSEHEVKAARNYGGIDYQPYDPDEVGRHGHQHFGTVVVSCQHADIRPLPSGVIIYGDTRRSRVELPPSSVPRAEVIDELVGVILNGAKALHNGAWATATLEVCLGILASAESGEDIKMAHQCGIPA